MFHKRLQLISLIFQLIVFNVQGYTNPVIDSNNPDPSAIALPDSGYLAVATSNHASVSSGEDAFPIYYSDNLVDWELKGHVFPSGLWPGYCDRNMWAPEIHHVNGRFLAYFSCSAPNSRHSIGVAVAEDNNPFGPYTDPIGVPLIYHNEDSIAGPIDQHYFKDPNTGKDYLIWKTDELVLPFSPSVVYIQEMEETGTAFINGSTKTKILETDRPEEIGIVEGMWMMYGHDEYWLFYSAANFQLPTYRMMVARSKDLMGPYLKGEVPVVETDWERYDKNENCTFAGPGHGSVVLDHSGDWWLIYHSWRYGHLMEEPGRVMLLDKLEWHGAPQLELWPRVSSGVPSDFNVQPPVL